MPLVEVENVLTPAEAEMVRGRLQASGIPAYVFDAGIASLIGPGLSGVRIMVDEDDEADARALLGGAP